MASFGPRYPVKSNRALSFTKGNPFDWVYDPGPYFAAQFATTANGMSAYLTFTNSYGQNIAVFEADYGPDPGYPYGVFAFFEGYPVTDPIPAGTAWTMTIDLNDGNTPRVFLQGNVIRVEAPTPSAPSISSTYDGLNYNYTFATAGTMDDPSFMYLSGVPVVYDNSALGLPNAVAAGSPSAMILDGVMTILEEGGSSPWSQASMLYYAPMATDNVSLTYQVVKGAGIAGGEAWVVISSSYDMSSSVAFYHRQWFGSGDTVGISIGVGPTAFTLEVEVPYSTESLDTFTANYNSASNTYNLYVGSGTEPLLSWTDDTGLVIHGLGYRYVGFSFLSGFLAPGVEIANWNISDTVPVP